MEIKENRQNKASRDNRDNRENRGGRNGKAGRDNTENRSGRVGRDDRDSRYSKAGRDNTENRKGRAGKAGRDDSENRSGRVGRDDRDSRYSKAGRDDSEGRYSRESKAGWDESDNREGRTDRDSRDSWDHNDSRETTIVYGKNAVTELLRQGDGVDTVYLAEGLSPAVANYYTALAKEAGAAIKRVHAAKLRGMCGTENHQGVAAYASAVEYATLEDLLANAAARGEDPLILLADGVEDPHNLGAMIRTALLAGAHGIVIPKRGGAQVTPIVAKTSAGASMVLPIARVANIGEAVRRLKEKNVFVYAADMEGPAMYQQNLTGPLALVLGSEGKGVSPLVKKLCDGLVSLPMSQHRAGVDSLNVSVAAGVLMYEVVRQRGGF